MAINWGSVNLAGLVPKQSQFAPQQTMYAATAAPTTPAATQTSSVSSVNSTDPFANLSADAKKALMEIGRAQTSWKEYSNFTTPNKSSLQQGSANWADQQRQALQKMGVDSKLFNPSVDLSSFYKQNSGNFGPAGAYNPQTGQTWTPQEQSYFKNASNVLSNPVKFNTTPIPTQLGQQVDPMTQVPWQNINDVVTGMLQDRLNYNSNPNGAASSAQQKRGMLEQMGLPKELIPQADDSNDTVMQKIAQIQNLGNHWSTQPNVSQSNQQLLDFQKIMEMIGTMQGSMNEQFQQWANQQAAAQTQQQVDSLGSLISQLTNRQTSELQGITNRTQDAQEALDDKSFQDFLAARQTMANRGLAGSGIASDQDTRLLLSKQRNLAGLMRDASQQAFDVTSNYGGQLSDAQKRLQAAQGGQGALASQLFQKMFMDGQNLMLNKAGAYSDMLGKILGYDMPTANAKLDNALSRQKMEQENKQFYDNLKLKAVELFGRDANGNLTLDAQKLAETANHNRATEANDSMGLQLRSQEIAQNAQEISLRTQEMALKLKNTQWEQQGTMLANTIRAQGDKLSQMAGIIKSGQADQGTKDAYQQELNKYDAMIKALASLSGSTYENASKVYKSSSSSGSNYVPGSLLDQLTKGK